MRVRRSLLVSVLATTLGCFDSSSSSVPPDGSIAADGESDLEAGADATASDAGHDDSSDAAGAGVRCDGAAGCTGDAQVTCTASSTCSSVKVVFVGWIAGADGGPEEVEVAADQGTPDGGVNGTVVDTASATDPRGASHNLLVGDFVTTDDAGTLASPLEYGNDNNYCDVPDFAGRTNEYYLAPMQGLPVAAAWLQPQCGCGGSCGGPCLDGGTGGACDYESAYYSQTCPNFGGNCVVTPRKLQAIRVVATTTDATCKVCVYRSTVPSASTIGKCVSPGSVLSPADLYELDAGASAPAGALLRLDDGTSCAAY
jgi:hypothetical protein